MDPLAVSESMEPVQTRGTSEPLTRNLEGLEDIGNEPVASKVPTESTRASKIGCCRPEELKEAGAKLEGLDDGWSKRGVLKEAGAKLKVLEDGCSRHGNLFVLPG